MSYRIEYENIISEFKRTNPGMADNIVDHYPSGQMEVVIKLRNGNAFRYDHIAKTIAPILKRVLTNGRITEQQWRKEFSYKLRRRMSMRGITQAELSELSGIPYPSVNKYVNGRATPSAYNVDRICCALQCPASELVNV